MNALLYQQSAQGSAKTRDRRTNGASVKIVKKTICGTDLQSSVATYAPGPILGHEGIGVVDKVGTAITAFHSGDRVIVSCISSCGKCDYCRRGMYLHCVNGGWILGNKIDGTQAECVRIPFADTSFYHIPSGAEEDALVTPMPLQTVWSHKIDPKQLITHRFKFDKILDAYDTFSAAAKTNALKVLIEA